MRLINSSSSNRAIDLIQPHFHDSIEEIQWLAVLKPNTVGVSEYRDDQREYLEVAVLSITARYTSEDSSASATNKPINTVRLAELVNRAIPYPVLLILTAPHGLFLSLAHKRWTQNEAGQVLLDSEPTTVDLALDLTAKHLFVQALALIQLPQANFLARYQGWADCLTVQYTDAFAITETPAQAVTRRSTLHRSRDSDVRITSLRSAARKEKQMTRQVAVNIETKALLAERQQVATCN
jgi:hypothetical protein